jgi:type IV secretion system protein TrbJ
MGRNGESTGVRRRDLAADAGVCAWQFGGHIVFDPTMYARQLRQLEQETSEVTNLARQLQYVIKNTTGGGGGVWRSNENLLANLSGIISETGGLSYAAGDLSQRFQQLYPGFQSGMGIVPTSPQRSLDTMLNTLNGVLQSVQMQANNFQAEQFALRTLEFKNNAAIGALQVLQTGSDVALAEAQQVQELRQLAMSATNAQAVAAAQQAQQQAVSQQTAQAIVGGPATISPW